jgi:hypothetical protein
MFEKLCFHVQNMLHVYRNYFVNRLCSVDSAVIFITSVICCRNFSGHCACVWYIACRICISIKFFTKICVCVCVCVCVCYVCDSKSNGGNNNNNNNNNNNRILGLEIYAVTKEAL